MRILYIPSQQGTYPHLRLPGTPAPLQQPLLAQRSEQSQGLIPYSRPSSSHKAFRYDQGILAGIGISAVLCLLLLVAFAAFLQRKLRLRLERRNFSPSPSPESPPRHNEITGFDKVEGAESKSSRSPHIVPENLHVHPPSFFLRIWGPIQGSLCKRSFRSTKQVLPLHRQERHSRPVISPPIPCPGHCVVDVSKPSNGSQGNADQLSTSPNNDFKAPGLSVHFTLPPGATNSSSSTPPRDNAELRGITDIACPPPCGISCTPRSEVSRTSIIGTDGEVSGPTAGFVTRFPQSKRQTSTPTNSIPSQATTYAATTPTNGNRTCYTASAKQQMQKPGIHDSPGIPSPKDRTKWDDMPVPGPHLHSPPPLPTFPWRIRSPRPTIYIPTPLFSQGSVTRSVPSSPQLFQPHLHGNNSLGYDRSDHYAWPTVRHPREEREMLREARGENPTRWSWWERGPRLRGYRSESPMTRVPSCPYQGGRIVHSAAPDVTIKPRKITTAPSTSPRVHFNPQDTSELAEHSRQASPRQEIPKSPYVFWQDEETNLSIPISIAGTPGVRTRSSSVGSKFLEQFDLVEGRSSRGGRVSRSGTVRINFSREGTISRPPTGTAVGQEDVIHSPQAGEWLAAVASIEQAEGGAEAAAVPSGAVQDSLQAGAAFRRNSQRTRRSST